MTGGYAGLLNLGWGFFQNDPQPLTLTVPGVYNIDRAAGAILTFNYYAENPATLSYRVNGNAWHDEPWPFGACCGTKTLAVPVPLAEVRPGDNTIQFKTNDAMEISNVDLVLVGAGGIPNPDLIFANGFQ